MVSTTSIIYPHCFFSEHLSKLIKTPPRNHQQTRHPWSPSQDFFSPMSPTKFVPYGHFENRELHKSWREKKNNKVGVSNMWSILDMRVVPLKSNMSVVLMVVLIFGVSSSHLQRIVKIITYRTRIPNLNTILFDVLIASTNKCSWPSLMSPSTFFT